ncbi:CbpA DnaJ-class molecular chaperone [uncultured Caudovirales phage]|uniref:CbpA DnaJ-class molecular chaperone n=1 Tax=uncultured Caudovirales phage TaxID=2100421 RepID=A0A6J5L9A0_9CAUD|nr:CbpA DnaJ-class molecular chaperone [uncultured Caudovirales phage]
MTYYDILGVTEQATADEIKRAYRKLASQHHPDKGGDKAKFQEIQAAYNTLADDAKRQQYDMERSGMGGFREFQFHHGDINDIFKNFGFGIHGDPFGGFRQQQRRNKDLRISIPLPLVSTLAEQTKMIEVTTTNGEKSTLEVKIPRGVTNGTNMKYAGLGDNLFNTIPRGDLYVQFNVYPAEDFIVNNIDLYTRISVNCLLAITGGKVSVTGLDGKVFELTIPPGTQPGTRFRLSHQGLYQLNTSIRGDLYTEVVLTVPQNLTPEAIEIIQSLLNT